MLLLGPCVLYLLAFSVFPLVYSLYVALCDYDQQTGDLTFIGLDNFRDLFSSDEFWQATRNTAIFTLGGVALQVVLGTALALFFDQKLRGAAIVRGILILPMLLTPIVIGLMWRMLLNPDWGLFTWAVGQDRHRRPAVAVRPRHGAARAPAVWTRGSGRRSCSSSSTPGCRRCRTRCSRPSAVDGASWWQRTRHLTTARCSCRRSSSRRSSAASTPSAPSTWSTASPAAARASPPPPCPSRRSRTASASSATATPRRSRTSWSSSWPSA